MPTYEYRCPNGHDFERFFRKISDAPADVACPECGKIAERRMSAGAGLLFKGSGFYQTDYRSDSYKKRAEADSKSSESKSTESKPADSKSSEAKSSESKSTTSGSSAKSEKKSKKAD